jgi:hypothetical protein
LISSGFGTFIAGFISMKLTTFYIVLNLRTCDGYESFGKFFVGNNKKFATDIFAQLKGGENVDEQSALQLDLIETINDLPVNIQMISCSLEELAENCKIITKETFKLFNLKET